MGYVLAYFILVAVILLFFYGANHGDKDLYSKKRS